MKKYEFTEFTELYRIRAMRDFDNVEANDLGGWIKKEENLSYNGKAWVSDNARVSGNARVYQNARISDNAVIFGNAWVSGNAHVSGNASVYGDAYVFDNAYVSGHVYISGNTCIFGNAQISGNVHISGKARIGKNAVITSTSDWFSVDNVGSRHDAVTFYKGTDGIYVCTGCFNDTLDKFIQAVKETHGDNHFAKEYLGLCSVARDKIRLLSTL